MEQRGRGPGAPTRASAPTGTPSSLTVDHRIPGSMAGTGETDSPFAPGSTRNRESPSGSRAGTRSTSAT